AKRMMKSIVEAYDYYRKNTKQANEWILKEAQLPGGSHKACELSAEIEPNLKVKTREEIRVRFSDEDMKSLKKTALFMKGKVGQLVKIQSFVDNRYLSDVK